MKKLVAILSIAVMMVGMVVPVSAQKSVKVDGVVSVDKAEDKDGKEVEIRIEELDSEGEKLVNGIMKPDNLKELLGSNYSKNLQVIDTASVYVWHNEKGKVDYMEAPELFPVTITFSIPGVKKGSNVQILHYYDEEWHVATGLKIGDGTVTGSFDKLSPFVFLVDKDTATGNDGKGVEGASSPDSEIKLSPKTGESGTATYVTVLVIAAFAGAVVLRKKKTA